MPDKKVGRFGSVRGMSPSQKKDAAQSDPGTVDMSDPRHAKAHSTLVDKFRAREERWRQEQSIHDQSERYQVIEEPAEQPEQEEEVEAGSIPSSPRAKGGAL